jgi:hypothetical protein
MVTNPLGDINLFNELAAFGRLFSISRVLVSADVLPHVARQR